jgi:hypothetical protein
VADTTAARYLYYSLLNTNVLKDYFFSTFFAGNGDKVTFTEEELMTIASRFFLAEKVGDRFRTRVCIGINGLVDPALKTKDYIILEAIVYEAIFERRTNGILQEPSFISNLEAYSA